MRHLLIIGLIPSLGAFICNAMKKGDDDLRAKVQNPVSSMYSLPLKLTADFGAPNGSAYFFNVNPVIPVTGGGWNPISRALIPHWVSVDGFIEGIPDIPQGRPANDRKTGWATSTTRCSFRPTRPSRLSGASGRPSPSKTIRSVRHRRPSTWIRCWRR
jgi:hypothetical protein